MPAPDGRAGTIFKKRSACGTAGTGLDQVPVQGEEPPDAEILDGEGGHDAAVDRGPADVAGGQAPGPVEIAQEAAGEAVARPGRVDDVLARMGQDAEDEIAAEDEGAVLAFLEQDERRPEADQGLPALMRFVSPVMSRASSSLAKKISTRPSSRSRASRLVSIQRRIVSMATTSGLRNCPST